MELLIAADLEDRLRSFDWATNTKLDPKKVSAACFCFQRALVLETNGKILLENGQFLYWLAVQNSSEKEENLINAEKNFKKAATAIPEEEWLVLYMRGKILEKQELVSL